jgi:hypothetical protein
MGFKARGWVVGAVVTAAVWWNPQCGRAQTLPPAPAPVVAAPAGATAALPPPNPVPDAPPHQTVFPPPCAPYEDCNGPLLKGDPNLDRPGYPAPGWFGAVELDLVGVHLKNRLTSLVTLQPGSGPVPGMPPGALQLPAAELEWTSAPRVEIGYRFPEGFGSFLIGYQSMVSDGRANLANFDPAGDAFLKTRLNLNALDLAYSSVEYSLEPRAWMRWRAGVRVAGIFFDNQEGGFASEAHTSNFFVGAGPLAGLDLAYHFCNVPGLALVARSDATVIVGRIKQNFEETLVIPDAGVFTGGVTQRGTQATPWIHFQLGVAYSMPGADRLTLFFGYDLEQWWHVGRLGDSRGDLTSHGLALRAEFNY